MAVSLNVVDYSRPIIPLFLQYPRFGTIHSVFKRAVNIAFDETILTLLSDELPRMPNCVRLQADVFHKLLPNLEHGMKVCIGNDTLDISSCKFSFHLSAISAWE